MSIWGWVSATCLEPVETRTTPGPFIIAGLMLVILVPMFIHEWKWRRRDRASRD